MTRQQKRAHVRALAKRIKALQAMGVIPNKAPPPRKPVLQRVRDFLGMPKKVKAE